MIDIAFRCKHTQYHKISFAYQFNATLIKIPKEFPLGTVKVDFGGQVEMSIAPELQLKETCSHAVMMEQGLVESSPGRER
jgi:hypothetical protein